MRCQTLITPKCSRWTASFYTIVAVVSWRTLRVSGTSSPPETRVVGCRDSCSVITNARPVRSFIARRFPRKIFISVNRIDQLGRHFADTSILTDVYNENEKDEFKKNSALFIQHDCYVQTVNASFLNWSWKHKFGRVSESKIGALFLCRALPKHFPRSSTKRCGRHFRRQRLKKPSLFSRSIFGQRFFIIAEGWQRGNPLQFCTILLTRL